MSESLPPAMIDAPQPAADDSIAAAAGQRLHPMSWLFVLLQQLKQFVVPLVALVVFGRGDRNELWPLIGVGVLALMSVWQYFTYRYGIAGDRLVVRSGLFERSVRVIPFARIHNVALQQSVLHRLFDVAEVRLESAGGQKPEAQMRVLRLRDAIALEALIRQRGAAPLAAGMEAPAPDVLLALPAGEVLRLGLVSNRGLIVVGAGVAGLSQFNPRLVPNLVQGWGKEAFGWGEQAFGWASQHGFGTAGYALATASLVMMAVVALRLLSVALALLQFWDFRLVEQARRLTVERGLLARWRTSAPRRRIQAWTLREGVLHRVLRRRSLDVDTAVVEQDGANRGLRELAPIATPVACDALIEHLLPGRGWRTLAWQPLPAAHWWRLWLPGIAVPLLAGAALAWRFGPVGLVALAWLPWAAWLARQRARRAAYAVNDALVAVRGGWWSRHWRFAEIDRLQALQITRSPLDRRCGTAALVLDTMGASALAPPLRIAYLPEAEAQALYTRLARDLATRALR